MKINQLYEQQTFTDVYGYFSMLRRDPEFGRYVELDGDTIHIHDTADDRDSVGHSPYETRVVPMAKEAIAIGVKFHIARLDNVSIAFEGLNDLSAVSAGPFPYIRGWIYFTSASSMTLSGIENLHMDKNDLTVRISAKTIDLARSDLRRMPIPRVKYSSICLETREPFDVMPLFSIPHITHEVLNRFELTLAGGKNIYGANGEALVYTMYELIKETDDIVELQTRMIEAGLEDWV